MATSPPLGAGNGILASMVLEYDIVDSTGRVRTHSLIDAREEDTSGSNGTRAPDKDEFHAGLVSLGAAGIISRLVLQAVPQFKIKQCPYPSVPVSAMLDDVKAFFSLGYSVSGFTDWKSQDTLTSVWIKSVVGREGSGGAACGEFHGRKATSLHPLPGLDPKGCSPMGVSRSDIGSRTSLHPRHRAVAAKSFRASTLSTWSMLRQRSRRCSACQTSSRSTFWSQSFGSLVLMRFPFRYATQEASSCASASTLHGKTNTTL